MIRGLTFLIAGAVVGGATVRFTAGGQNHVGTSGRGSGAILQSAANLTVGRSRTGEVVSVSETLEIYRAAVAESDVAALRAELRSLARGPMSAARIVQIDATLARLSDLAPAEAVAVARSLGLGSGLIAGAYLNLARVDPDRAIRELGLVEGRSARREVALAILDAFGDSSDGIDRVSAGLPESERDSLKVEWIASRAEHEPVAAIREAQSLRSEAKRREALERVGRSWAAREPRGALTRAAQLPGELQSSFLSSVFAEWARLDAADFLAWLSTATSPPSEYLLGVRAVAGIDPDLAFRIADDMPGNAGRALKADALGVLAERDPDATMSRVTAMPPGDDRESMLATLVSSIARRDPDAALERAREFGSSSQELVTRVVQAIAQTHPDSAIEFIDHPPEGFDPSQIPSLATSILAGNRDQAEPLANKLIAKDGIPVARALRNVVANRLQQDPERAFEWVFANEARLGETVIGPAAQAMARADPATAANYLDRVPADYRSVWIHQVAAFYGAADMNAALSWIDRFQSDEAYPSALGQILSAAARTDPLAAAQVLTQSSPAVMVGAARQVAQEYARVDPRAAIRWAGTLGDASGREEAVSAAISAWAAVDQSAARNYTMNLARGEERDRALSALLRPMSRSGDLDRDFFDAYSSNSARQQALATAIPLVARNDTHRAEELLHLVTSANTRAQLEERLPSLVQ